MNYLTFLLVALGMTVVASPLVIRALLNWSLVDVAGGRSSHSGAVPRGGGLALAAALVATQLIGSGRLVHPADLRWLVPLVAFGLLGFVDDARSLSAAGRLGVQVALGLAFGTLIAGRLGRFWPLLVLMVAFWLVGFVNVFNFMDGINGISAMTTVCVGSSLALASLRWNAGVQGLAFVLVGAAVGFLPSNLTNRMFLGDVGSYLLGAALAVLAVRALTEGVPLLAVAPPFGLYVGDVAFTLVRRFRRHERLMEAHREHVYQRLANDRGWGHPRTTLAVTGITLTLAAVGQLGAGRSLPVQAMAAAAAVAIVIGYLALPVLAVKPALTAGASR